MTLDGSTLGAVEVCGLPGGIIANPPCVDAGRRIAVGFDSGNAQLVAWRYGEPGAADAWTELWPRPAPPPTSCAGPAAS
ncbi:MAG: hypothetical protein R2690_17675 [Acidimicrobiales bacterium]